MSFGEICFAGTHNGNTKENTSERRTKCIDDTVLRFTYKKGPQTRGNGVPSNMHPRDKTRAHLSASQRKMGLGECHLGPAEPRRAPVQVRLGRRFDLIL